MNDPERDPWPSVDERPEPGCPYCEAHDDEPHQWDCPMVDYPWNEEQRPRALVPIKRLQGAA